MARRLANVKTRAQTGFDYVVGNVDPGTPFGKKRLKDSRPFFPGQENELTEELDKINRMLEIARNEPKITEGIREIFHVMKDNSFTIERSKDNILSMVELFEMKSFLLQCEQLIKLLGKVKDIIPEDYMITDTGQLLDVIDPRGDRLNTFYIYEEFSPKLGGLRKQKHEFEVALRKEQKKKREVVKEKYGVVLTPKFDYMVSRSHPIELESIRKIEELEETDQDYMSVTFSLKKTGEAYAIVKEMKSVESEIGEEEERVREALSHEIWSCNEALSANCDIIGALDLALSKAIYALEHNCVRPEIVKEHVIRVKGGRQLQAEDILISQSKKYIPVDISLEQKITCITGANMGGKTVSLKMVGMVQLLAQYGFFVPCEHAEIGLANHMQILIGDSQSLERGLSSFGSEMEELKEILDNCTDRSFILIDEIASGTNPAEGLALTKSLIDFLMGKPYMALITTHYDIMEEGREIKNMQVAGLADADFSKIKREIAYANRKERIQIVGKYMDYRLVEAKNEKGIPRDALNIAEMLGIDTEIINLARQYLSGE